MMNYAILWWEAKSMAKNKTKEEREQYVVKANALIQKTRYNLSTQQQKIVLYAISKIKPEDTIDTVYTINIADLCEACGINCDDSGFYYKTIKEDILHLTERQWCTMPDRSQMTISWIGDAHITDGSGMVEIRFHPWMQPYLFELKEKYTQYQLQSILVFRSKHAIRLYELLKSYAPKKVLDAGKEAEARIALQDLKEMMMIDSYPRWVDFDRFVIKKAVDEINRCADDIHVEYTPEKDGGRSIAWVRFEISAAKAMQMLTARQERRKRLK